MDGMDGIRVRCYIISTVCSRVSLCLSTGGKEENMPAFIAALAGPLASFAEGAALAVAVYLNLVESRTPKDR